MVSFVCSSRFVCHAPSIKYFSNLGTTEIWNTSWFTLFALLIKASLVVDLYEANRSFLNNTHLSSYPNKHINTDIVTYEKYCFKIYM